MYPVRVPVVAEFNYREQLPRTKDKFDARMSSTILTGNLVKPLEFVCVVQLIKRCLKYVFVVIVLMSTEFSVGFAPA